MKSFLCILFLSIFPFFLQDANGQNLDTAPKKNVIHGTLGTILFVNSANLVYDRLISRKTNGFYKSYYATIGLGGLFAASFAPGSETSGLVTTIGITGLTGLGKHHFETRVGIGYYVENYTADEEGGLDNILIPNINIGYRKENLNSGFIFRTGIGIHEFIYVGFG